jgi:hypothetical protein
MRASFVLSWLALLSWARAAASCHQPQPKMLDGSYPGDVGFDPLGLSEVKCCVWDCIFFA